MNPTVTPELIAKCLEKLEAAMHRKHTASVKWQLAQDRIYRNYEDPKELGANAEWREAALHEKAEAEWTEFLDAKLDLELRQAYWRAMELTAQVECAFKGGQLT